MRALAVLLGRCKCGWIGTRGERDTFRIARRLGESLGVGRGTRSLVRSDHTSDGVWRRADEWIGEGSEGQASVLLPRDCTSTRCSFLILSLSILCNSLDLFKVEDFDYLSLSKDVKICH